ncbi:hypothetical protein ACFSJ1_02035 [Trinickia caryophylli]|uniref:hypothetical protein n=1 Tax=Trinickia caryophylli TaxID=28094 RepID=UPI0036432881
MSQTSTPHTQPARRPPVRNLNSRQMRAVRKELLILRAEVERAEFAQARHELRHSLASFGWLKLLVPGFATPRSRGGKGLNASITDWVANHPLASSLASLVLAKPLRATLSAGAKPLVKWGSLGARPHGPDTASSRRCSVTAKAATPARPTPARANRLPRTDRAHSGALRRHRALTPRTDTTLEPERLLRAQAHARRPPLGQG